MFLSPRFLFRLLATASITLLPLNLSAALAQETKTTPQKTQAPKPVAKPPVHAVPHKAANTALHHADKMCKTATPHKMTGQHTTYHHKGKVLQCVGYVHLAAPNFKIRGNAHTWWKQADEKNYVKGHTPEPGSVLSFRATKRMVYGHVAMVRSQEDDRTIRIDHAHWGINGIDHNIRCVDVSEKNDWTAVRVALRTDEKQLGSVYPTNGFIYPWTKEEVEAREKQIKEKPFGNRPTAHVKFKLPS